MAVWMLLSTPVHSMVMCGWAPSMSVTVLANCWAPSALFTVSWKSAPNSLAMARRSGDRSEHSQSRWTRVKGMIMFSSNLCWCHFILGNIYVFKNCILPVMTTCEAPIALATIKQTNPIGPVERQENNRHWYKHWHLTLPKKVQVFH